MAKFGGDSRSVSSIYKSYNTNRGQLILSIMYSGRFMGRNPWKGCLLTRTRRSSNSNSMESPRSRSSWRLTPRPTVASPLHQPTLGWSLRHQSNMSSSPTSSPSSSQSDESFISWLPVTFVRLVSALGMIHVVSEYGVTITLCEGPSMQPTIQARGEIILVDLLTPRLFASEWNGESRTKQSRMRQEQFVQHHGKKPNKDNVHEVPWHEPCVPVNELSSSRIWRRLWAQLMSGISVGDVLVVQHPHRHGTVCKRVLGMPGDTVVVSSDNRAGTKVTSTRKQANLLVIPDGHVWLEGDNAYNSSDSRQYGPLPAAMTVGRVICRVWPLRGNARIERGGRPATAAPPGTIFPGSTILPAGYEGEEIRVDRK